MKLFSFSSRKLTRITLMIGGSFGAVLACTSSPEFLSSSDGSKSDGMGGSDQSGKEDIGLGELGSSTGGSSTSTPPLLGSGQACDAESTCPAGEICAGDKCATATGSCSEDTECGGDRYCCAEGCRMDDSGEGACIPYGTGPRGTTNPACSVKVEIGLFDPAVQCAWTEPPEGDAFLSSLTKTDGITLGSTHDT